MEKFDTVEAYLAAQPPAFSSALQKLRNTIKEVVPNAEETMSYGMPAFKYKGVLVYYAAFKNHCSFFVASHAVMAKYADEVEPFKTSKGTLQFTPDKPISTTLIKKLVKARVMENEAKALAKKK